MASADVSIFGNPPTRDPLAPDPSSNQPRDDLDNLFNFSYRNNDTQNNTVSASRQNPTSSDPLGILSLANINGGRKNRPAVAKLDETRLLSANGIPKLQKITKDRLKFRGKGHEFSDVERLLSTYQLWLDDLFPKAKFADGLAIIEKLGHKKGMQVHRRGWIEDGKPRLDREAVLDDVVDVDDDYESDASYNEIPRNGNVEGQEPTVAGNEDASAHNQPDEDELDTLLAEDAARNRASNSSTHAEKPRQPSPHDDFDDDMEALRGMEDDW